MHDQTLFIDGCDQAVVGLASRCGQPPIVIYSHEKLVSKFVDDGMTADEAEEWVSYNITGAWMGPGTPGVMVYGTAKDVRETLS
jgi:hypothetical protein